MRNPQNEVLSFTFQSRGYAFRIVGKGTEGPDMDDVRRQFMAEDVQGLNVTRLKKIHRDMASCQALLPKAFLPTDLSSDWNRSGTRFGAG